MRRSPARALNASLHRPLVLQLARSHGGGALGGGTRQPPLERPARHLQAQSLGDHLCRCSCKKSCQADTCCPIRQAAHALAQGEGNGTLSVCVCVCLQVFVCANNDLRPNLLLRAVTCDSMPLFTPKHLALTEGCACV